MARILISCGYTYHSLSDVVRREATDRRLPPSRENLVRIGNEMRRRDGPAALVKRLLPGLVLPAVIDSIRNPGEVEALRRIDGFILVAVLASEAVRFDRIRRRGRAGDPRTLEKFRRFEERENSRTAGEQRIADTVALASAELRNDGPLEDLDRHVDAILTRLVRAD